MVVGVNRLYVEQYRVIQELCRGTDNVRVTNVAGFMDAVGVELQLCQQSKLNESFPLYSTSGSVAFSHFSRTNT